MAGLPDEPSFEQLSNQAKDLRRAVLAGDADALAEVAERIGAAPSPFPLHAAQLVVARRYGFPSWARLKRHVEVIEHYSRFPDRMTAGPPAGGPGTREERRPRPRPRCRSRSPSAPGVLEARL